MKKKINWSKIFDIGYWLLMIIATGRDVIVKVLKSSDVLDLSLLSDKEYIFLIFGFIFMVLVSFGINIIKYSYLTVIYIGVKIAKKMYIKGKIDKVDLKNDTYYRDILPKYSASLLSYLDDFKIDIQDVVATLMVLELRGKIKINDNNITVIDFNDDSDLEENEKYILNRLKDNTLKDINLFEYGMVVREDAKRMGLVFDKGDVKRNIKSKIIKMVIFYCVALGSMFLIPILFNAIESDNGTFMVILFMIMFVSMIFNVFMPYAMVVSIIHYKTLNTIDPYVRSDIGKDINLKLEGLRKYLLEFSRIEDKSSEMLKLWEEYLVYSVIFGINTNVVDDICNKI